MGIMNGTTNFMLSKMESEGADYQDVLVEAQRLGYAEADPTADVEGHDVQAKIAILTKLAFGETVALSMIPTKGISSIGKVDFEFVKDSLQQSTIKLLGTAILQEDARDKGKKQLAVFVSPTVVPHDSPLSSAKGAGNMVVVHSENMISSTFAGPGAGRFPTANSVMNDLVRIAQGKSLSMFPTSGSSSSTSSGNSGIVIESDFESKFYIRITAENQVGIIR
jgi:homoserine dehydrogenase